MKQPRPPKPEGVAANPRHKKKGATAEMTKSAQRTLDEVTAVQNAFFSGSPIVTAILGQAMVEAELEDLIRTQLRRRDDETWAKCTNDRGPINTFSQKITLGSALRLMDDVTKDHLDRIRVVRNEFAHSKTLIDFSKPDILGRIQGCMMPPTKKGWRREAVVYARDTATDPRAAFLSLCLAAYVDLMKKSNDRTGARIRYMKRRAVTLEARALANALDNYPQPPPANALKYLLQGPGPGPKSQASGGGRPSGPATADQNAFGPEREGDG